MTAARSGRSLIRLRAPRCSCSLWRETRHSWCILSLVWAISPLSANAELAMIYQEDLRAAETLALWIGNVESEDALITYLGQPFETDFGFGLDLDSLPDYACSYPNPGERRRLTSSRPFEPLSIHDLLRKLPYPGRWLDEAILVARSASIETAKVVVAFPNLRYQPEFALNPDSPLSFLGNIPWPAGAELWTETQKLRVRQSPFPTLVQDQVDANTHSGWTGIIHLADWINFASYEEVSLDGWAPSRGRLGNGDLRLHVHRPTVDAVAPSVEQATALKQLLRSAGLIRDEVLNGIYRQYGQWREGFYDTKVSNDGGKTWTTGWGLPDQFPPRAMPKISNPDELRRLIRPIGVHILTTPHHGTPCVGFGFNCRWDDEHGLGVLTHNGRVVKVGQAEEAFASLTPFGPPG